MNKEIKKETNIPCGIGMLLCRLGENSGLKVRKR